MGILAQREKFTSTWSPDKMTEWSSLCNDVFHQYLDDGEPFSFPNDVPGRSTSSNSANLLDPPDSNERGNQVSITSAEPSSNCSIQNSLKETSQPTAKEPRGFWTKTLSLLEKTAAQTERKQKNADMATSLSNSLSSSTGLYVDRQWPRIAANGKKNPQRGVSNSGSPSCEQPMHIPQPSAPISTNSDATTRDSHFTRSKMMNQRGFRRNPREFWTENMETSPLEKYGLQLPHLPSLASPPPPAKATQADLAAFSSPPHHQMFVTEEDHGPPQTFHPSCNPVQTPDARPLSRPTYTACSPSAGELQFLLSQEPENLRVGQPSPPPSNVFDEFDFFELATVPTESPWSAMTTTCSEPSPLPHRDHLYSSLVPTDASSDNLAGVTSCTYDVGLGITCDPSQVTRPARAAPFSVQPHCPRTPPLYFHPALQPSRFPGSLPTTPHQPLASQFSRLTPPATPRTGTRSSHNRRRSSNSISVPRRTSRLNRATKSSGNLRHHITSSSRGDGGLHAGFMNFTPEDHEKILSGVAPSGSSKTKARREKEQLDRTKHIQHLLVKALTDAGKDLEPLRVAGLFSESDAGPRKIEKTG